MDSPFATISPRRHALARRIPDDERLLRLPHAEQRACAVELLAESIDAIGSDGHQPDPWETLELRCAIDALEQRLYASVLVFIGRALLPVLDRQSFLGRRPGRAVSINDLRHAFAQAQHASAA